MRRLRRRAQTTVETMLLISVIVIGVVGAGYWLAGGSSGIVAGFRSLSSGAQKAYVDPARAP
ncbi:MAG: hypothetical protein H6741_26120 [Alphaproteobacteria bacterium]|nr:hypothetical protein [Alphaproteobacteria bacterium]